MTNDNKLKKICSYFCSYLLPVLVLIVLFRFILLSGVVRSSSMEPSIETNSFVFANRLAYIKRVPQRGEIILFRSKENGEILCKRIIGLPEDEIVFKNGYVYINDTICEETYLDENVETNCSESFTVPAYCYFVMGDNRENSYDSRYFQEPYISKDAIIGKCIGSIPFPDFLK